MVAAGRPTTTVNLRVYQVTRLAEDEPRGPWTLTTDDLVDWLAGQPWAIETRKSYRAALVSFYRWAVASGRTATDPTLLLPPIRSSHHPPRPTPELVYRTALDAAEPRVRLMLELAARQGLRRGEIARVHSDDLREDLAGWSLLVHGKGGKLRLVPLEDEIAEQLRTLPPGWAFPGPAGHLSEQHVGVLMGRALPGHWTAHTLRHRFASQAYAGTRDLAAVQDLLGHARPETTRGYIMLPQDALRAAVAAARPAA